MFVVGAPPLLLVEFPDGAGDEGAVGEGIDERGQCAVVCGVRSDPVKRNIRGDDRLVIGDGIGEHQGCMMSI